MTAEGGRGAARYDRFCLVPGDGLLPIVGFCPMGCGHTLLESGGYIMCAHGGCPRPTAASEILAEPETEHVVRLGADSFDIQHPLRERLDGQLFDCPLHEWLTAQDGPPEEPGRYRVRQPFGRSVWEQLP